MFCIDDPIRPQPIFDVVQELGQVSDEEMYRTFNMGMGFAIVLRQDDVADALQALGDDAKVVGQVTEGSGCGIPELDVHCDSY
jgi:phosphoribosylformylglycinamidine cyclo-ligase